MSKAYSHMESSHGSATRYIGTTAASIGEGISLDCGTVFHRLQARRLGFTTVSKIYDRCIFILTQGRLGRRR